MHNSSVCILYEVRHTQLLETCVPRNLRNALVMTQCNKKKHLFHLPLFLSSLSRNVAYICMSNICCFETPADKLVNTREAAGLVCGGAGSCLSVPCWGRDLLKLRRWCRGVLLSCLLLYAAVVTLHFRVLLCVAMCCCMLFVLLCAAWTVVCCCRYCLLLWPSVCFMSTTSSITADKCFRPVSQITIETYSDIVQFIVPSNCRKIISTLVS